jgi:predicted metal-dependent hydrolase
LAVHEEGYRRGISLFNQRNFFDAHEVWEDVWRESTGPEKKFLQGLIQVAVAFHHHSTGNLVGAQSLLERARRNLAEYPEEFGGIGLAALLDSMAAWREAIASGEESPEWPRIRENK